MALSFTDTAISSTSEADARFCTRCGGEVRKTLLPGRWWCDGCDPDPTVSVLVSNVRKGVVSKRKRK